jgi:hypothetical protein
MLTTGCSIGAVYHPSSGNSLHISQVIRGRDSGASLSKQAAALPP